MRAGVALGSNLGDRLANLRNARKDIAGLAGALPPMRSSAIYETEPVGCEKGAAKFLNAAIEFDYTRPPDELLHALAGIEKLLGRAGDHPRNVSRTIDLDLLFFGEEILRTAELELPHPRIAGREFVLRPLADICPDRVLPGQTRSIQELLSALAASPAVVRLEVQW